MLTAVDRHIIALLLFYSPCICVSVHSDASSLLFFNVNCLVCPRPGQHGGEEVVSPLVDASSCSHTLHILCNLCQVQFVNCDVVVLSCKSDIYYYCGWFFPSC